MADPKGATARTRPRTRAAAAGSTPPYANRSGATPPYPTVADILTDHPELRYLLGAFPAGPVIVTADELNGLREWQEAVSHDVAALADELDADYARAWQSWHGPVPMFGIRPIRTTAPEETPPAPPWAAPAAGGEDLAWVPAPKASVPAPEGTEDAAGAEEAGESPEAPAAQDGTSPKEQE